MFEGIARHSDHQAKLPNITDVATFLAMVSSYTDESLGLGVMPVVCGDKLLNHNVTATQQDANEVVQLLAHDKARAPALGKSPFLSVSLSLRPSLVLLQRAMRFLLCITCATCGRCERPSGTPEQTKPPHFTHLVLVPSDLISGLWATEDLSRVAKFGRRRDTGVPRRIPMQASCTSQALAYVMLQCTVSLPPATDRLGFGIYRFPCFHIHNA